MYAEIKYTDTPDKFHIVLTQDIRLSRRGEAFNPKDENDFIVNQKYYCKYSDCFSDCEEDHEHYDYYSCFIYALGESRQSLENKKITQRKRKSMPPLRLMSTSSSDELPATQSKKKVKTVAKITTKLKKDVVLQRSSNVLQSIVDNSDSDDQHHQEESIQLNSNNQRPPFQNITNEQLPENRSQTCHVQEPVPSGSNIGDPGDNVSESVSSENNHENFEQVQPVDPLNQLYPIEEQIDIDVEGIRQDHVNEVVNVNDRPAQLNQERPNPPAGQGQDANVQLKRKKMKIWINNLITDALEYYEENGPGNEERRRRYTINHNRELYLGEDISVPSVKWNLVEVESNEVTFVRLVAVILWSNYHLVNRAVEISQVFNKNRIPNRSPVKELEYNKLRLLISLYYDYLVKRKKNRLSQVEIMQKLRETTHHLSKKIAELKTEELQKIRRNARRRLVLQEAN